MSDVSRLTSNVSHPTLPRLIIIRIFDFQGLLGQHQRPKRVDHHGQLIGFGLADAFFHGAGMRAVGDATGVEGNLSALHAFAAHEVTVYIVQHFIGVDVAVVVWRGYRLRVVVIQPWAEAAKHKVVGFEGLVYRRWLVQSSGDGFEVMDGKTPREMVAVPAHEIERVRAVRIGVHPSIFFYHHVEIALLIVCLQVARQFHVALAEGSVFHQLAVLVPVPLRCPHGTERFDDEQPVLLGFEIHLVDDSSGYQQVIAVLERYLAITGFQYAAALVHKDDLIRLTVFIEIVRHGVAWCRQRDMQVGIYKYGLPAIEEIVGGRDVKTFQAGMFQVFGTRNFGLDGIRFADLLHQGGRVAMVNE